jgi:rod shape determining protein RodA
MRLPWGFILAIVAMAIVGFATLFSSTYNASGPTGEEYLWAQQASRFCVGFVIMLIMAMTPISWFYRLSFVAFAVTVVLLLGVEFFGLTRGGATRWLKVGPLVLQPSELAKLTLTLALARYYHYFLSNHVRSFLVHIGAIVMIAVPFYLVFAQPDFGTSLAVSCSGLAIVFLSGISMRFVLLSGVALIASIPLIYSVVLQDYQRERVDTMIASFSGGETDALAESYQIEQGLIAIGSGGWRGKGYLQGIQSQQDYVPEQHTDFIFTVIAEEFGFIGSFILITAFAFLIGWSLNVALQSRSWFGRLAASGATAVLVFYVVFNIAMVIHLLPVVGMPLPLISHGGTALFTTLSCFGIILSAHMSRGVKDMPRSPF